MEGHGGSNDVAGDTHVGGNKAMRGETNTYPDVERRGGEPK